MQIVAFSHLPMAVPRMRWFLYEQSMDVFAGKVRVSLWATYTGLCGGLRVWVYGQANMEQFAMSPFLMKGALHRKRLKG